MNDSQAKQVLDIFDPDASASSSEFSSSKKVSDPDLLKKLNSGETSNYSHPAGNDNSTKRVTDPSILKKLNSDIDQAPSSLGGSIRDIAKGTPSFVAAKIGNLEDLAKTDAADELKRLEGREPGVDYESGLPLTTETAYKRADNESERFLALKKKYPDAMFSEDAQGNMIVVGPDGKRIAAGTGGGISKRIGSSLLASVEPIAGMSGGAAMGAEAGLPLAPFTYGLSVPAFAMLGAGAGGAAGKEIQEAEKSFTGYEAKDAKQLMSTLKHEAGWSAVGEGVGRALLGLGRASRRFPAALGESTPETNRLLEESLKAGARPPIYSAAPGAKKTQFTQSLIEKVIGNSREGKNSAALDKQLRGSLKASGMDDKAVNEAMQQIVSGKLNSRAFGEEISTQVKNYIEGQEKSIAALEKESTRMLDEQFKEIEKIGASKDPNLAETIKGDIETSRQTFSTAAQEMYGRVDALVGDTPFVPTRSIKETAQQIIDNLPVTKDGEKIIAPGAEGAVKYLKSLINLPEDISFKQAQLMRSEFNRMSLPTDLTPGVDKKLFRDLAGSVNTALKDSRVNMKGYSITNNAMDALEKADNFYRQNIKKFKNSMAIKLTKEAGERGSVDPESVINLVAKPGYESRLKYIMKMVKPETQKAIVAEDFAQMLAKSTDPLTKATSGKALLRQINARAKTGEILYGKDWKNIKLYAQRLAAKDGHIFTENLPADQFTKNLEMAAKRQEELDRFMSKGENYLAKLSRDDFEFGDAVNFVVQPGKEVRLQRAIEFFGDKSPIVQKLRQQALTKIFVDAAGDSSQPLIDAFAGNKLKNELRKYSTKQLEMLFPNGMDKQLKNMADIIEFYTKDTAEDKMAAGLAAGSVKSRPLLFTAGAGAGGYGAAKLFGFKAFVPAAAMAYVARSIMQNPQVLRWFGPGLYGDNAATIGIRKLFENVPRAYIQSFAGQGEDEE